MTTGSRSTFNARSDHATQTSLVELVPIRDLSSDALLALNRERALSLDLADLHAIADHFTAIGREPTDLELAVLANAWSDDHAHRTFRSRIALDHGVSAASLHERLHNSTAQVAAPFVRNAPENSAAIVAYHHGVTVAMDVTVAQVPSTAPAFATPMATIGNVVREVMSTGHHPIAVTDILCCGPTDIAPRELVDGVAHPRQVLQRLIDGIGAYGNSIGVPVVAGGMVHDHGYLTAPVVYAGCIAVAPDTPERRNPQAGDLVVLMSDPSLGRLPIEALAECKRLYTSAIDCGAVGLAMAMSRLADAVGADVDVTQAFAPSSSLPLREQCLNGMPHRMVVAVAPQHVDAFTTTCSRYGVDTATIGTCTGDGVLRLRADDVTALELDLHVLHGGWPQRTLSATLPQPRRSAAAIPVDFTPGDTLLLLLSQPNIASKTSVVRRYDHEIRGATLVRPIVGAASDAHADGVVIAEPTDQHGLAIGIGITPWFGLLDPERMAHAAVDEAIRNVVSAGADPAKVSLIANFSWGDIRRQPTFGDLVAAVDGCCNAATAYTTPIVRYSESLNNDYVDTDGLRHAAPPTLAVTAVAHVPDVDRTCTPQLTTPGNLLVAVGRTANEFGGSHYAMVKGVPLASSGVVPAPDLSAPDRYQRVHLALRAGIVRACHDVSEGGLAVAIAEMCIAGRMGARIERLPHPDTTVALFSESLGRLVCEVAPTDLTRLSDALGDDITVLGEVTATRVLSMPGVTLRVDELVHAFNGTIE